MRPIEAIEHELDIVPPVQAQPEAARWLLGLAEEVLEAWVAARGEAPTVEQREGFRLLALHHQGAAGNPSFNACRETCREIAFHYNLLTLKAPEDAEQRLAMMVMLVRHLTFFVGGKLQVEGLGDFCCASRPVRQQQAIITE
ncbi:MAG: hypothetical protein ABIQ72_16705 [Usitatibacter sp.]